MPWKVYKFTKKQNSIFLGHCFFASSLPAPRVADFVTINSSDLTVHSLITRSHSLSPSGDLHKAVTTVTVTLGQWSTCSSFSFPCCSAQSTVVSTFLHNISITPKNTQRQMASLIMCWNQRRVLTTLFSLHHLHHYPPPPPYYLSWVATLQCDPNSNSFIPLNNKCTEHNNRIPLSYRRSSIQLQGVMHPILDPCHPSIPLAHTSLPCLHNTSLPALGLLPPSMTVIVMVMMVKIAEVAEVIAVETLFTKLWCIWTLDCYTCCMFTPTDLGCFATHPDSPRSPIITLTSRDFYTWKTGKNTHTYVRKYVHTHAHYAPCTRSIYVLCSTLYVLHRVHSLLCCSVACIYWYILCFACMLCDKQLMQLPYYFVHNISTGLFLSWIVWVKCRKWLWCWFKPPTSSAMLDWMVCMEQPWATTISPARLTCVRRICPVWLLYRKPRHGTSVTMVLSLVATLPS